MRPIVLLIVMVLSFASAVSVQATGAVELPLAPEQTGAPATRDTGETEMGWLRNGNRDNRPLPDYPAPPIQDSQDLYGLLVRSVLATGLVVLVIVTLAWFLRGRARGHTSRQMRVLDQFHFAPGKQLYLVQVYNRLLILGCSGDRIVRLAEIRDEKDKQEILLEVSHGITGRRFDEVLEEIEEP